MAASQSRTVYSKTHRVCPIHTRNIGPIGPLSSTIPSPWIESLPKGRFHMPCTIQRATVPGKWLRPNHVRYITRPTGSVLSTQEILDPSVYYPVLYHHLESSPYPKAGFICHARFKELLYQENGCVPITYGTLQDPQGLSYPNKKYWTHRSIIQYYTITLNRFLTQRQVSYAMHDSKSYWTRKMAASQSRTVHSKTHRVCPIHTRNIGPIGPLSSTKPSPWIESLPKGRFHMPCTIQRATVPRKWLRPNHVRFIPRPTGSVLSTQEILDPSVHHPVLYHHLESSPYPKAGFICHARFKELLYQENGYVPITYGTNQDPQGLSYPHKKYWTHRSIIQYYIITLNRVLTQRQVSYAMHDSKSYCTRKIAASQSHTVHSKTHRVCPIHTRNIGPIGPLCSTRPPWMKPLPNGRSDMLWMIRSYCTSTWGQGEEWEGEGWRRWRMKGKGRGRGWKREIINPPPTLNPPSPQGRGRGGEGRRGVGKGRKGRGGERRERWKGEGWGLMERGNKRKSSGRGKLRGREQILPYPSSFVVAGRHRQRGIGGEGSDGEGREGGWRRGRWKGKINRDRGSKMRWREPNLPFIWICCDLPRLYPWASTYPCPYLCTMSWWRNC